MKNAIRTKHNLDFEACPWHRDASIMAYRVGTCHGQYTFSETAIMLISVMNSEPGNGHLEDVFEWFEYSAKTNSIPLIITEFFNDRFKTHCIEKRGFTPIPGTNNVIKMVDSG